MPLQQGSPEFGFKSVFFFFFLLLYACIHKIIPDLRTIREPMAFILYACLFYAKWSENVVRHLCYSSLYVTRGQSCIDLCAGFMSALVIVIAE